MEIKNESILFDVWIGHGMWEEVQPELNDIILESIAQRERLHGLELDRKNFTYEKQEYKFERKYCLKVSCKIIRQPKKKKPKKN